MFEVYDVLLFVLWTIIVWGLGWYARDDKVIRDKKREELETAIKPSGVYLEDQWMDDYNLDSGREK